MKKITFRPCTPDDVDVATPLMYESGPESFNFVFQNKKAMAIDFLKHAFPRKGGEFSFDNHFAIVLDDKIIGVGSAFSAKRASGFMLKDLMNILRFYGFRAIPVLMRGLQIEQILKLPKKKEICLAHIAVAEGERSKGYGEQLLHFLMEKTKEDNSNYFVLDVSTGNPKAQKLYERMGFKVRKHIISKYKSKYGEVPNFYRMEMK